MEEGVGGIWPRPHGEKVKKGRYRGEMKKQRGKKGKIKDGIKCIKIVCLVINYTKLHLGMFGKKWISKVEGWE